MIFLRLARHPGVACAALVLMGAASVWSGGVIDETDRARPLDFGSGPGRVAAWAAHRAAGVPGAMPDAAVGGVFGAPVPWPIIPIHMALLPDGRVLNFGSDTNGIQGAGFVYDVWNPALGTGSDAHMVLPNTTATNIFCAGQSLLAGSGTVLMVGGTLRAPHDAYDGIDNTTVFTPGTNGVAGASPMVKPRWYPAMAPLPNGDILVAGGTDLTNEPVITPELFDPVRGWRALPGAASSAAFGDNSNWFYPRLFVAPDGHVVDVGFDGVLYDIDPRGKGAITQFPARLTRGGDALPVAMYAPGMLLSLRLYRQAEVIDINGPAPVVRPAAPIDQIRNWASMTVLADGSVLVNGGSVNPNQAGSADNKAELWTPGTGAWTEGARAAIPRLYHSTALLLADGTVVTAGGGDPGPLRNLNAEIYYPPYLFDRTGAPAARPALEYVPAYAAAGQTMTVLVDPSDTISGMTLVRAGSSTHSANLDQRFFKLPFTQNGPQLTATLPGNPNVLLPGYYMVFVFQRGVPSVAGFVSILA